MRMRFLKENFFSSWGNTIVSLVLVVFVVKAGTSFVDWAFLDAVWRADPKACRAAHGACWGFIAEKHRFILFGTYPFEQHWRPALATVLLLFLWGISASKKFRNWKLLPTWTAGLAVIGILMWGGVFGLPYVENERWGGLILTLLLATFGIALAFPLAVLLALGRRSNLPAI